MGPPGSGGSGSTSMPSGGSPTTSGPITTLDCTNHVVDPGPTTMQLLSHQQYLNTVLALAGDVPGIDQALGDDVTASAFGLVQPDVTQVQLEHYQKAANAIAAVVVGNAASLAKIAPCAAGATGTVATDCAKSLVQKFGALAYRAPVTDAADIDRHVQLFNVGLTTSYAHGIELLLRGMLQSPRFLYRVEVGTTEKVSATASHRSNGARFGTLIHVVGCIPTDSSPSSPITRASDHSSSGSSASISPGTDIGDIRCDAAPGSLANYLGSRIGPAPDKPRDAFTVGTPGGNSATGNEGVCIPEKRPKRGPTGARSL